MISTRVIDWIQKTTKQREPKNGWKMDICHCDKRRLAERRFLPDLSRIGSRL
jgi:hypothetical protein